MADGDLLELCSRVLREVRRAKSQAGVSLRAPVRRLTIHAPAQELALLRLAEGDVRRAANVTGRVKYRTTRDPAPNLSP
jgi:valyl-tRNA synthetase